nr:amino acid ABC transporter permease [Paenibacillus periandrae]
MPITLTMLFISLLFGLLIGLGIALVRIHKKPIPYAVSTIFISYMRCTPTLVQLFVAYYGLPLLFAQLGLDINSWSPLVFAIVTFTLNISAYFSEMFRSAYLTVGQGQLEAAYSVGMKYHQALRRIVLPQALAISIPNLTGNIIYLLKESALAFSIGVIDMLGQADVILATNYHVSVLQVYAIIAVIYWLLSVIIQKGGDAAEKKLKKGHF